MSQKPLLSKAQLEKQLEISNFHPNSILRGAQLTWLGGELHTTRMAVLFVVR